MNLVLEMTIRITIKRAYNPNLEILTFNAGEKETLKSIVYKIQAEEGTGSRITTYPILFNNKPVEWTYGQTLDSYNITNGSILTVITKWLP